jgi:hypothetical protein
MASVEDFAAAVADTLTDVAKLGDIAFVRTITDILNEKDISYIFVIDDLEEVIAVPRIWAESL